MADRKASVPIEGENRFGSRRLQNVTYLMSQGGAGKGHVLAWDAVNSAGVVTTVYLWVSADGKLRTGTIFPTDTEAGTVVGSQS